MNADEINSNMISMDENFFAIKPKVHEVPLTRLWV